MMMNNKDTLTVSPPSQALTIDGSASKSKNMAEEDVDESTDREGDDDDGEREEHPVPSLEEDMANNPERTRQGAKYARGLWASGMLEIYNGKIDEDIDGDYEAYSGDFGPHCRVFVAKVPICAISKRFQEPVPTDRSWPVVNFHTVLGPSWSGLDRFNYWRRIDAFLKFVYRGEFNTGGSDSYFNLTESDVINWCLGAAFKCPKLQNIALKSIMKRDATTEAMKAYREGESAIWSKIADDSAYLMERIGVVQKGDGEFEPHKLMSYMIDRAQVDAAKKPKPRFAPWHVFNRHRYLMSEDLKADKKRAAQGSDKPKKMQRVS
ncbi:hypothetical protein BKA61DRAFT_718681 [Leptodontidium sp. MPI-SDFR-AT-0119]|nr:hypothetical protein BKA61DRAFT_718681 [Leptodontidium sp. MPI-SDFR-AT-0119]